MSKPQEDHLVYWRELAARLADGTPMLKALAAAAGKLAEGDLQQAVQAVADAVKDGATLSEAMAQRQQVFGRHVCALVRAGEAGGVLDVIAQRIVTGMEEGTLGPDARGPEGEAARFWRTFALLLSSGVPILHALELVAETVGWIELSNATRQIRQSVKDGADMSSAMKGFPEVFPTPVCEAVALGEEEGELDRWALRIAEALEKDDLYSLTARRTDAEAAEAQRGPVVQLVNCVLLEAIRQRASDIHLDPTEQGHGRARLRIDGVLRDTDAIPKDAFAKLVNRLKIMSALDLAERRVPQTGRISLTINREPFDLRVSVVPTFFGERVVVRILRREGIQLGLDKIGLDGDDLETVRRLCHLPNGLIVSTGPAGSGKTTLLYSMLQEVDRDRCCVMTVEDPVEYSFAGMGQIQVDARRGLSYARALHEILRQDPDVVMVGEIRDLETIQTVIQTALTGHLVFTTLHTNDAVSAIVRMLDVGLEPYRLNAALTAVIAQRLVRVLCPQCRRPAELPADTLPPEAVEFVRRRGEATFHSPAGCQQCAGGYRGRTAIYEILTMNERLRRLVAEGADGRAIADAARAAGMRTLLESGLEKAARGITTVQEVIRVVPYGKT